MYSLYSQPSLASIEGEQSILNALMRYPSIASEILSMVEARDFYYHGYAGVFAALKAMYEKSIPYSIEAVLSFLRGSPEYKDVVYSNGFDNIDNVIDAAALSDIYSMAVLGSSATWYAGQVKDLSRKRVLMKAFEKGVEDAHTFNITSDEVQRKFEARLKGLSYADSNEVDDVASSQAVLDALFEPEQDVFPTGLIDLDHLLNGGVRPKQVMVVGARPGMGKSMLGLSIADHWAKLGKNVFFSTIEMTAQEMAERRLSFTSGIPLSLLRGGVKKLPDNMPIERLKEAHRQISQYPGRIIFNEDKLSPTGLHLRCKALKGKGMLDAVVIDYLQIMRPDKIVDSQVQSIGLIAYAIKDIAKELNVPVIALAQLNREVSRRGDKPQVTDLRESGAIEQMADVVLLIHREQLEGDIAPRYESVDLIVGKNRSGNRGTAHVLCDSRIMKFANLEK